MNVIHLISWAPLLMVGLIKSILPRSIFIKTYTPSSELDRNLEESVRNTLRLSYYRTVKRISK